MPPSMPDSPPPDTTEPEVVPTEEKEEETEKPDSGAVRGADVASVLLITFLVSYPSLALASPHLS